MTHIDGYPLDSNTSKYEIGLDREAPKRDEIDVLFFFSDHA